MKTFRAILLLLAGLSAIETSSAQQSATQPYYFNRAPLKKEVYVQLPLGSIKAGGWLRKQLELQRDGFTGHAEALYPGAEDLGSNSDWLGGTGNSWEKVPYYVKGLVALAYTLGDDQLKQKAQKWIDYTLDHQQENGLFGPPQMKDWWPKMPFMYALQGYYEATGDKRVVPFLSKYFRYQLASLDTMPLSSWAKSRAGDNMELALWVYNKTGEPYLLELVKKLKEQAYPWVDIFNNNQFLYYGDDYQPKHMVNVAQALKFPVIYSQLDASRLYTDAMQHGITHILHDNGLPQGLGAGTEFMSGKSSVEGVETCTVVEWMQSLETAARIIHDAGIGDDLEKVAFNALPAQFNRNLTTHSYYTLPNEVRAVAGHHGFNQDYTNGLVLSPYSGFPCCRYNMHMGWPYFIKNSCLATPDGGIMINTYGPMEVSAVVAGNIPVKIIENTDYPFEEQINISLALSRQASFPLQFRIPGWCRQPEVLVNGKPLPGVRSGQLLTVNRTWNDRDSIRLNFPMTVAVKKQVNNAVSIERGPLVYALKMKQSVVNKKEFAVKGFYETEITPESPWNYGLVIPDNPGPDHFTFIKSEMQEQPFLGEQSPVRLKVKARQIPSWTLNYNQTAAMDVPFSPVLSDQREEEITLVPFGSQNIRVSIFPTIGNPRFIDKSFEEDFDNNTAEGWVIYGGGWYYKDNAIHCASNGENSSGAMGSKVVATATNFSNFVYSADLTLTAPGDAGLIFRVSGAAIGADAYRGYYVGLNQVNGTIELGKSSDNKWIVIASARQALKLGVTYQVRIKAVGDHVEVFLNNSKSPVVSAKDQEYTSGSIGLRAYGALAKIDKIRVKALP